ncbi:MAG: DUF1521 domain-containing protein [Clostridia bacterium]|nr:DUF1521 domain-containing protein [Deltaproteobacteria bacterium]
MNDVAMYTATSNQPIDRPVTASSSGSRVAKSSDLPAGLMTKNADGSITTPGGYKVINDGGYQWRVVEPDGKEHKIWGDPHVDENNDGTDEWHFNEDASFILPDGTKIFCDTNKLNAYGGQDVTLSTSLTIQYRDQIATMDTVAGGPAKLSTGGVSYDSMHEDGALFVLSDSSTFVDGKTLGDLYDAGGDFKADIDVAQTSTISANAAIAVAASLGLALPGSTSGATREQNSPSGGALSALVASVHSSTGTTADLSGEPTSEKKPKATSNDKPKTVVTGGALSSLGSAALTGGSDDASSVGPAREA